MVESLISQKIFFSINSRFSHAGPLEATLFPLANPSNSSKRDFISLELMGFGKAAFIS